MRRRSSIVATFLLAAAVRLAAGDALAQGNICLELESRLMRVEQASSTGSPADARQYDNALAQQRNEIDRAMAEARRAGCVGGFLVFQRRAEPKCPQLMATIDQMKSNLTRLMRARAQSGGDPFALGRERSEILRSLALNGCRGDSAANGGNLMPGSGGLFGSLFGAPLSPFPNEFGYGSGYGGGTYRTLCVRSCDGFYFPISFSTLPGKFAADAATCQQMCPGAEATLYIHRNPGEEVDTMVSLDGRPYTALPTAFRFRREYDKACTCGTIAPLPQFTDFSNPVLIEQPWAGVSLQEPPGPGMPMPRLRPRGRGEDPETAANRAGGLDPVRATTQPPTEMASGTAPDGRKIRIVGPADFYAQ